MRIDFQVGTVFLSLLAVDQITKNSLLNHYHGRSCLLGSSIEKLEERHCDKLLQWIHATISMVG